MSLLKLVTKWAVAPIKGDKKHLIGILLFIALALVVPLIGLASIMLHSPKIELDTYANLRIIARLKAEHIDGENAARQRPCRQGEHVAAAVLRASAQHFLYPLIQAGPIAGPGAETLLVRRQGNSVIFQNELARRSGTAMSHLLSSERSVPVG